MSGQIAVAAEWKVTGAIDQGLEYDDNLALRSSPTPAYGYLLRPSFKANWSTAIMGVGISGQGDIRRYDDERWNCDNVNLGLDQHYTLRRHQFSVTGRYGQSCSYAQQASDTGVSLPRNQSDSYSLSPNWRWLLTRRDRLSLSPSYTQTNYTGTAGSIDGEPVISLRDNKTYSVNLSEEHQWNKRLTTSHSAFFSHSEFSSSSNISNGSSGQGASSQNVFGFQSGGQFALSRLWSINASGGGRWVQSPGSAAGLSFGETLNLTIDYKGRSDNYALSLSRSVSPSAFGQIQDVKSLNMSYGYEINRELSFRLSGSYSENQAVGQSLVQFGQKRNYYNATAEVAWKLARDWRLTASYRYRMQEYGNASRAQSNSVFTEPRDSNAIMLHLNYNWDGLRVSR